MEKYIPRPEHPNPQWRRESFVNLNGEWQFEIDANNSGADRGYVAAESLADKINLPFCPESRLSGVGHTEFMECVWYKRILTFTEEELEGNRVIFHIGAADFKTTVYVNGKAVGLPHIGGYTSFEYDITAALKAGDNLVTIRCEDDTKSPRQPGGKQSMKAYSFGCYYTRTTGIWQTVWYEIVPETHINYMKLVTDYKNATASLQLELSGSADLLAEAFYEGRKVGEARKSACSGVANLELALSECHLWELGAGRLYDLKLTFGDDVVNSYFGLRSAEMIDGRFCLNGKPVFMRLVLDQGFYPDGIYTAPTEQALIKDIECGLSAGFNGARLHEKVFEPLFLYHADRLGYMVWGEYGNWGIDHGDIANLATFLPDWIASVRRDYNHPAIIGWCPFNETSASPEWGGRRRDPELLRIVYEQTKLADPTRPCIDTSGWIHVVTDIYDVHDYDQDPASFKEKYDKLYTDGELYDRFAVENKKCQTWRGEPVFMSEYGGIGLQIERDSERKKSWSYGRATSSYEEFYERYKGLTDALLDNPRMIGFCYTQLTDVEQEKNGLFNYDDRSPKFDMEIISAINKRKAAIEE